MATEEPPISLVDAVLVALVGRVVLAVQVAQAA
jgi:hypothetical protein